MRRFAQIMAVLGILVLAAYGGHELLVSSATGEGDFARWSASTCASCHGASYGTGDSATPPPAADGT